MKPQGTSKLLHSLIGLGIIEPWDERQYRRRFHAPALTSLALS